MLKKKKSAPHITFAFLKAAFGGKAKFSEDFDFAAGLVSAYLGGPCWTLVLIDCAISCLLRLNLIKKRIGLNSA